MPVLVYFPVAIGVVTGGSILAAAAGGGMFARGYVIDGLIAVFLVLIPNALAFWFAADVPFPTLYRTIAHLQRRWRPAAMVIVAGLAVLAIHLVFFPLAGHRPPRLTAPGAATGRSHHTPDREVKTPDERDPQTDPAKHPASDRQ